MAILIIVLVISFSLLFGMRAFARRQQTFADARQTARRAVDYLSYYLRGASDMNSAGVTTPNALVMYVQTGSGTNVQVSYDNVGSGATDPANAADTGTDILTLGFAQNAVAIPISYWNPQAQPIPKAANAYFDFRMGCDGSGNEDVINLRLFEQATGCTGGACDGTSPCCESGILTLVDSNGNWTYYQITNYQASNCAGSVGLPPGDPSAQTIHVTNTPGQSDGINPPGGPQTLSRPISIMAGVQYFAFRVLNHQLQQKTGLFDKTGFSGPADTPGTAFQPLLDNVEDLQFAYIYDDGTIANSSSATRLPVADNYIPEQNTPALRTAKDITHVVGMRVTVVARSSTPLPAFQVSGNKYPLLGAEDHTPTQPASGSSLYRYYRYRLTNTVMLRSRMMGE